MESKFDVADRKKKKIDFNQLESYDLANSIDLNHPFAMSSHVDWKR